MDPKHFLFDTYISHYFVSWDCTELYVFANNSIYVVSMNPFRIKERIQHKLLTYVYNVKYLEEDNTFLMNNEESIIKFDPDTKTVTELIDLDHIPWYRVSPDGKIIVVLVGKPSGPRSGSKPVMEVYEELVHISTIKFEDAYGYNYEYAQVLVSNDGYIYLHTLKTVDCSVIAKVDAYSGETVDEYKKPNSNGNLILIKLTPDNKYLLCIGEVGYEIIDTKTMTLINTMPYDNNRYNQLSSDGTKIFRITPNGTEIYSVPELDLLAFIDTTITYNNKCGIHRVTDCGDLLFISTDVDMIHIYDIKKSKFLGQFEITRSGWRSEFIITKNQRYLFMVVGEYLVRFDLVQLGCDDQKKALLAGEDIPDNPVYRFTHDRLYDWHLMGEIFKFLPKI
jgi:hypothetical protein